jgi:hypothetical protein
MKVHSLITLALVSAGLVHAADWPQWGRTNDRNMYSPETGARSLRRRFKKGTQSRHGDHQGREVGDRLGTQSYGNTTVANGRVVGTSNDKPRDPRG